MLNEILNARNLPKLKSSEEMIAVLAKEEYGNIPPAPSNITFTETDNYIPNFCAGKALSKKVDVDLTVNNKDFHFHFFVTVPNKQGKHPFFVCINFQDLVCDYYIPTEEIIDNGFAVLSFCYENITSDDNDFTNGLAGILYENGKRNPTDAGKISMWAWAAQRVMDYAQTQSCLNLNCAIVCGHSRLGKTALWTAANDSRFQFAYSNNSGCSGAAISRGKCGETISNICNVFPYWFCLNYLKYANNEDKLPFDQHYLLSSIAPRYVYVASAKEDTWADPLSELLSCKAASEMYESYGVSGLVCSDRAPEAGDEFHAGSIGYHMRNGQHFFSREDWQKIIKFVKLHSNL